MENQETIRFVASLSEVWSQTQNILSRKLSKPGFDSWIRPIHLISLSSSEAVLGVPNEFVRTMLTNNYLSDIKSALESVINTTVNVSITVSTNSRPVAEDAEYIPTFASIRSSSHSSPSVDQSYVERSIVEEPNIAVAARNRSNPSAVPLPPGIKNSSRPGGQLANISSLNPKYTFRSFVVGSNNRFTHSAALAVAQKPGQAYNPLFIYGGVGLGKTHVMHAIAHEIAAKNPGAAVRYISCERFTNELVNSIKNARTQDFRKRYRQLDVLLVDDIQFIEGKESTQEEFFHTFNALRDNGKQIVLSSDRPPQALARLEDRLRSRFEWGLISDIQSPDLETRIAILRKKCELEQMSVDDDVIDIIANTYTSNIRELEGALIRVNAYSTLTGERICADSALSILQPAGIRKEKRVITVEAIISAVAREFKLEPGQLKSSKRTKNLARPRHIAMYLAHELAELSYPVIGSAFGGRAHTSALYACDQIKKSIDIDQALASSISRIKNSLRD